MTNTGESASGPDGADWAKRQLRAARTHPQPGPHSRPTPAHQGTLGPAEEDDLAGNEAVLRGFDPEADVRNTAERRTWIRKQAVSAGSQVVLGLIVLLLSIALVVLGITNWRDPRWWVPAAVCAPPGLWFSVVRWRRWLGKAPYCYRLLSSLGENADNILVESTQKRIERELRKIRE
jgi:hypothetical protein